MSNLADQSAVRVRRALSELSDWGLKRRIQWLRWLDHLIASRKDQILATIYRCKKKSSSPCQEGLIHQWLRPC